jgi:hypothetical protein
MYEGYTPVTTINMQYRLLRMYRGNKYRIILKAVGTNNNFAAHVVAEGEFIPTVEDIDDLIEKTDGDLPF